MTGRTSEEMNMPVEAYEAYLRNTAHDWYVSRRKYISAIENKKKAEKEIREAEDALSIFGPVLERSVQPICGSATLPHMRTYGSGHLREDNVVMVVYFHQDGGGREGGRIEVQPVQSTRGE